MREKRSSAAARGPTTISCTIHLEGPHLSNEDLRRSCAIRTIKNTISFLCCGWSAFNNKACMRRARRGIDYLPAPVGHSRRSRANEDGHSPTRASRRRRSPFSALAVQIMRPLLVPDSAFLFRVSFYSRRPQFATPSNLGPRPARTYRGASCRARPTIAYEIRRCAPETSQPPLA